MPNGYEEMIREIAGAAGKYGFAFHSDTLTDYAPHDPGRGHEFRASVLLLRQADDFMEDSPRLTSSATSPGHTGK
jgi:hypothetical protein